MPIAMPDSVATPASTPVTVLVLQNDQPDDGSLAISSLSSPANGRVGLNPDQSVTYRPNDGFVGTDGFSYTIVDATGVTATASVTIKVEAVNRSPVAKADVAVTGAGRAVSIDALANDSDPDGDALSVVSLGRPARGRVAFGAGGAVVYTPDAGFSGQDSFTYVVADPFGLASQATVTVNVGIANQPPSVGIDRATTVAGSPVTIPLLANDVDPEGGALAITGLGVPSGGQVLLNPDQTVRYTPRAGFVGQDSFSYTVADSAGATTTGMVTVEVTPVQALPVAREDRYTVPANTMVVLNVLANDDDPAGGALAIVGLGRPAHGRLGLKPDQTITYTPDPGYSGADSFTYSVAGAGGVASATVRLDVVALNQPPVARAETASTPAGSSILIDVLANDVDPEGGALRVVAVGNPARGQASLQAGGRILYTPEPGFVGRDSFTYSIADAADAIASATVQVDVIDAGPALVLQPDVAQTFVGTAVEIPVLTNDAGRDLVVTAVSQPAHGSAAVVEGQRVRYEPGAGYAGPDGFTYTVTDGRTSATAAVDVQVRGRGQAFADGTYWSDATGWVETPEENVASLIAETVTFFEGTLDGTAARAVPWSPNFAVGQGAIIVIGTPDPLDTTRNNYVLTQGNPYATNAPAGAFQLWISKNGRFNAAFRASGNQLQSIWAGQQQVADGRPFIGVLRLGGGRADIFMDKPEHETTADAPSIAYEIPSDFGFTREQTTHVGGTSANAGLWKGPLRVLLLKRRLADGELELLLEHFGPRAG